MTISFGNFQRLSNICDLGITGTFDPTWSKTYIKASPGGTTPAGGGSGLIVNKLTLNPGCKNAFNNLIYILVSKRYRILYVGISTKGLKTGVFGSGRLAHHVRKMLAIPNSSTNHTTGWIDHAIERYNDNLIASTQKGLSSFDVSNMLDDVYISIGDCGHDNWSPKNVEGSVLDEIERALTSETSTVSVMNTGSVSREPIVVNLPPNIKSVSTQITAPFPHTCSTKSDLSDLTGKWNIVPANQTGPCEPGLLVNVKPFENWSMNDIMGTALSHLKTCCATTRVFIYVQIPTDDWNRLWAKWHNHFSLLAHERFMPIEIRFDT